MSIMTRRNFKIRISSPMPHLKLLMRNMNACGVQGHCQFLMGISSSSFTVKIIYVSPSEIAKLDKFMVRCEIGHVEIA